MKSCASKSSTSHNFIFFKIEQEDGRIYCHYTFSTQTLVDGGEWFDTS